jgi:predicted GNAT family acetyltransferase
MAQALRKRFAVSLKPFRRPFTKPSALDFDDEQPGIHAMKDAANIDVVHNAAQSRFEVHLDGQLSRLEYRIASGVLPINHTEVPPALGGRGIAGMLVAAAVAYAKGAGLRVVPNCSYARSWLERNPEALRAAT